MKRLTDNKIILVVRPTRLDDLIARFNTLEQAKFYITRLGADFSDYQREHENYKSKILEAVEILENYGHLQILNRHFLPNFLFGKADTVAVLGQDGLVANTIKYLDGQPVIGLNPDPKRWDGVLLPFRVEDLPLILPDVFNESRNCKEVVMAKAKLNNGLELHAVNDLFIGPKSHVSMRYNIQSAGQEEFQSSSGIIVSTGFGSTGWFKSLMAGAKAISSKLAGRDLGITDPGGFAWDADYLYFTVREPFPSQNSKAELVFGKITAQNPLRVDSLMPENGVIFSDGIENDFLEFNSGTKAVITPAEKKGRIVV